MPGKILLSTAYLPPIEYFSHIIQSDEILIEREENYLKQSYRNRCYILSESGPLPLTVPVYQGSFHKTPVKDIRIDYSKRWQQVHIGALTSAYSSSPYFLYYFETLEKIIISNHIFLLDLNMELLLALLKMMKIKCSVSYTTDYNSTAKDDLRYTITPKRKSHYNPKIYNQVFSIDGSFNGRLSVVDLVFNTGPEACLYFFPHDS